MVDDNINSATKSCGVESGFEGSTSSKPIDIEGLDKTECGYILLPLSTRHTSGVWKHYQRIQIGKDIKAMCNYCELKLAGGSTSGTTHLKGHTRRCPKRICQDIRQTRLFGKQTNPTNLGETLTLAPYEFHQEDGRRDVAEMIALHEYPLSMVEHYGFRKLCKTLQPGFKVPCRNTTRKDIMKRYDSEKEKMTDLLMKIKSKIALTTDMWTSNNQKKGYMAVTAHFIDNSWKLQSRILRFLYVEAPHTKEVLAEALCKCIYDWNLDCRISSITLDNCTTNNAVMDIMRVKLPKDSQILKGKFLHMRCCAHILNLIVQDGLGIIGEGIERVRGSVVFWTGSILRVTKFENTARSLGVNCSKKLVLDCKTRWNSTYEMLQVAIKYKDVFDVLGCRESDIFDCVPLKEDWQKAELICEKLELFSDATHDFSGTKYPTANLYFTNICEIRCALKTWAKSSDPIIQGMAICMQEKFNKYWADCNTLLAVAAVLDPMYKIRIVRYYYKQVFEDEDNENDDDDDFDIVKYEIEKVKEVLRDLVAQYSSNYNKKSKGKQSGSKQQQSHGTICGKRKLSGFAKYLEVEENQVQEKSELEKYLETPNVPISNSNDFDILVWWKTNGSTSPILQNIARDILSIPVSSVASESAFSTSGRVLSPHRSRLLPSTVEALMCTQNWIWTNIRGDDLQEVEHDDIEEDEDFFTDED